ncbi:hypothetical protein [Enterococcus italicus]|uniref:hypothetical protein n=1 Tax=Enterococcus italicus TaxID=246144 RepID=UPI003F475AB7
MSRLYFSKRKFQERASIYTKRQVKDHLDIIDGMEVVKEGNHYMIPNYTFDGEHFYMYPISESWCTESKQEGLFEQEEE